MSVEIHPTAIVDKGAELGEGVVVGPFSIVGEGVRLGDRCTLFSHVNMVGQVNAGPDNEFHPFCSIGAAPQDLGHKGNTTSVDIGDKNIFREYVSIHRGTVKGKERTVVGSHNLLMSYVHLGHDVSVGDHNVIVNSADVAGHVKIGDRIVMGGQAGITQFVTVGNSSYIGGASILDRDIPPFCTAYGNRVQLKGINIVGLRRQGLSKQIISELVDFFRMMEASALSPRSFVDNEELMTDFSSNQQVMEMAEFIRQSKIGIAPFVN